jgi:hypothetical protein
MDLGRAPAVKSRGDSFVHETTPPVPLRHSELTCHSVAGVGMRVVRKTRVLVAVVSVVAMAKVVGQSSPASAVGGNRPLIHSVTFSGTAGDYTALVRGSGFGTPTVSLPYSGDVSNFRIGDNAQFGQDEWGYTGDTNVLRYTVWSGSEVEVSGLGAEPGDALVVAVWNALTGRGATWAGDVPPVSAGAPKITSVSFSALGTPVDLHVVVKGEGFGPAPTALPLVGDLNWFYFWDGRAHCGTSAAFAAGGRYFGDAPADAVTLRYRSWSDTKIVIGGFAGAYGVGCSKVQSGDPVAISVWSTADTSETGPQAARKGLVLYGIPGN